jgi:hypothetical protein
LNGNLFERGDSEISFCHHMSSASSTRLMWGTQGDTICCAKCDVNLL